MLADPLAAECLLDGAGGGEQLIGGQAHAFRRAGGSRGERDLGGAWMQGHRRVRGRLQQPQPVDQIHRGESVRDRAAERDAVVGLLRHLWIASCRSHT